MSADSRTARAVAMRAVFAALCNSEAGPEDALSDMPQDEEDAQKSASKMKLARDIIAVFHARRADIGAMLSAAAPYETEDLSATERALICAGAAEMIARPKTPAAVVINEFVEIAKQYGSENGVKFVNAALDNIARRIRSSHPPASPTRPAASTRPPSPTPSPTPSPAASAADSPASRTHPSPPRPPDSL